LTCRVVVDILTRGAFLARVGFELTWLGILSAIWIATAAVTAQTDATFGFTGCDVQECQEAVSVEALAFAAGLTRESTHHDILSRNASDRLLTVMVYWLILLVLSLISQSRGNSPWSSTVRDHTFLASATGGDAFGGYSSYQTSQAQLAMQSQYNGSLYNVSTTPERKSEYQTRGQQVYPANAAYHAGVVQV
jgi:hypothetical protein